MKKALITSIMVVCVSIAAQADMANTYIWHFADDATTDVPPDFMLISIDVGVPRLQITAEHPASQWHGMEIFGRYDTWEIHYHADFPNDRITIPLHFRPYDDLLTIEVAYYLDALDGQLAHQPLVSVQGSDLLSSFVTLDEPDDPFGGWYIYSSTWSSGGLNILPDITITPDVGIGTSILVSSVSIHAAVVPAPPSLVLLGMGTMLLAVRKRFRKL